MKKFSRILAFALALAMILSCCAAFAEDAASAPASDATAAPDTTADAAIDENPVLVTIGGDPFSKTDVDEILQILYNNSYVTSLTDYGTGIAYIVQNYVLGKKIEELQFDVFTDEEKAAFAAEAQKQWDDAVAEYVAYYLSEDTEEARAELTAAANQYFIGQGSTLEGLAEYLQSVAVEEKLKNYILEGQVTDPTDEEINAIFDEYVGYDKESYENKVPYYEYYTKYMGSESWYVPAGYRAVTRIRLAADEALLNDYQTKLAAYEEALSAPAADEGAAEDAPADVADAPADAPETTDTPDTAAAPAPVTIEDVEAARAAVLASVKEKTDAIYQKLADGAAFGDLIAEYAVDPAMTGEYAVHKESLTDDEAYVDDAFIAAAFSEKMAKPGDVSDPAVTSFGVHILYYLRDIQEGAVEMTDDIETMIRNYLVSVNQNSLLSGTLADWTAEFEIVYNQEAIDQLSIVTETAE